MSNCFESLNKDQNFNTKKQEIVFFRVQKNGTRIDLKYFVCPNIFSHPHFLIK